MPTARESTGVGNIPVVLPYKINIDGKLVKVEYKLFYDPLTTEKK